MSISSLKKELITSYSLLPGIKELEHNKLTIITAAGIIMGTPLSEDTDANDNITMLLTLNSKIANQYREQNNLTDSKRLPGNDGFIQLKDVTMITNSNVQNFMFLNVFYDQIIAVTIGNNEPPKEN